MTIEIKLEEASNDIEHLMFKEFDKYHDKILSEDIFENPLAYVAYHKGEFVGSVVFQYMAGNLYIKYLIVKEEFRELGLGKKLIEYTEEYAKKHFCSFIYLETFSFQALEFYIKLGFNLEFTRDGFLNDSSLHYLRKFI